MLSEYSVAARGFLYYCSKILSLCRPQPPLCTYCNEQIKGEVAAFCGFVLLLHFNDRKSLCNMQ